MTAAVAGRDDLVERGHGVAGTDLAGVLAIIIEITGRQLAFFVADQPITVDLGRVELDLELDVLGDGDDRAAGLVDKNLAGFLDVVQVGVVSIAVAAVGEPLHGRVFQVAHAEPEHVQEHPAAGLVLDEPDQGVLVGDPDVEIAVGAKDHAVHAALDEIVRGLVIGLLDTGSAVGPAVGVQFLDHREDPSVLVAAG